MKGQARLETLIKGGYISFRVFKHAFYHFFQLSNLFWILRKQDIKSCDALNAGKSNSSQYVRA